VEKVEMNIQLLQILPVDVLYIIYNYLPQSTIMWLTHKDYMKNHKYIKHLIPNKLYDNYIRNIIRKDCDFVFQFIIKENYIHWFRHSFTYKNTKYPTYTNFLHDLCIQNNSTNCKNIILEYMNMSKTGFHKNQHKKNRNKNIRWKI